MTGQDQNLLGFGCNVMEAGSSYARMAVSARTIDAMMELKYQMWQLQLLGVERMVKIVAAI